MYSIYVCITLLGKESNVSGRRNKMGSRISPYFSPIFALGRSYYARHRVCYVTQKEMARAD